MPRCGAFNLTARWGMSSSPPLESARFSPFRRGALAGAASAAAAAPRGRLRFLRDLGALPTGFRQADRYGLLRIFHLPPGAAALKLALLVLVHRLSDLLSCRFSVFGHRRLLCSPH